MTLSSFLDQASVAKGDPHHMGSCLEAFPAQCSHSLTLGQTIDRLPQRSWRSVVFCAMGGSALAADFIAFLGQKRSRLPFAVVRNYDLPPYVDENSLVVALSYSGNTEETLACYEEAKQRGAAVVAICSGGALGEKAKNDGVVCCRIPGGFLPRMALGYLALPPLMLLSRMDLVPVSDKEWFDCYLTVRNASARYRSAVATEQNPAKSLALTLQNATVAIWGSVGLTELAARSMKNQINENAQCAASWGVLPEVDHNEIMAMDGSTVVFLRDKGEDSRIARRFDLSAQLLRERRCVVTEHWGEGETLPGRMLESLCFGAWVSYYLSLLRGVDPWPMKAIEDLKRALRR